MSGNDIRIRGCRVGDVIMPAPLLSKLASLGIRHRFTRPYTPRTNGKVKSFLHVALCASAYLNSQQRAEHLPGWLHHYNWQRPHAGLNHYLLRLAAPV